MLLFLLEIVRSFMEKKKKVKSRMMSLNSGGEKATRKPSPQWA